MAAIDTRSYDIIAPAEPAADPVVRSVSPSVIGDVLAAGLADFQANPTHHVFVALIYPLVGLLIGSAALRYDMVPLLFPLAAGFALVGPFAAIGIYELSRRRELGLDTTWSHAFDVVHSPSFGAILRLGGLLLVVFVTWVAVADWIRIASFGKGYAAPLDQFLSDVFTTDAGRSFLITGTVVGFFFALLVLSLTVVAFPLLLDRRVGASTAMATSLRATARNPLTVALWGLVVAGLLALGSIPFFFGLAIVLPLLGHATWHLYRRMVEPETGPRPDYRPAPKRKRYAADFPASLFVPSSEIDRPDAGTDHSETDRRA